MERGVGGWLGLPLGRVELEVLLDRWRRCGEALGSERGAGPRARLETAGCSAQHRAGAEARGLDEPPGDGGKKGRFLMPRGPLLAEISRDPDGAARDVRRNQEKGADKTDGAVGFAAQSLQ